MNEPRVYKQSPILFIVMLLIFGILFVTLILAIGQEAWYILIPFGLGLGFMFVFALFTMTSKVTISDDEISTQNLLGTKSLRWSEINQVSGSGYSIKLKDVDRNITLSPSQGLPGYTEIIEWIGVKRPDLFSSTEYNELTRSWANTIFMPIFGLLIIGVGIFAYTQADSDVLVPTLIFTIIGLVFIVLAFTSPQAIRIEGNSIVVGYLFNQKTFRADEIASVILSYTQTRNGKHYFVGINLTNRKMIRVSGLRPNLPVAYLVLKTWLAKNK